MKIDGRDYINFVGTGYLALSHVAEIRSAVLRVVEQGVPFAQALPAVLGGIDPLFAAVERAAADACGTEASVYFSSGYLIGMVGLASLEDAFDLLLLDEAAYYNLKDAAKLFEVPVHTFAHCDVESLRDVLHRHATPKQHPLVVTDGVFAATGRVPPLADYATVLARYEGRLFVDEAHAFGVVGENGRGAAEYSGVQHLAATGATLSKALCAQGAIVACSLKTAARLRTLPAIRGACAGSPLSAVAATESLRYMATHPEIRKQLRATTDYFRARLRSIGLDVIDSPAPIVSFKCGDQSNMQAVQRRAFDHGIYVHYSKYIGTGSEGMLRCAVFRDHTRGDIDALVGTLSC
jgi:7-keto-8-aminopelargonate synthetase-like enzyme